MIIRSWKLILLIRKACCEHGNHDKVYKHNYTQYLSSMVVVFSDVLMWVASPEDAQRVSGWRVYGPQVQTSR